MVIKSLCLSVNPACRQPLDLAPDPLAALLLRCCSLELDPATEPLDGWNTTHGCRRLSGTEIRPRLRPPPLPRSIRGLFVFVSLASSPRIFLPARPRIRWPFVRKTTRRLLARNGDERVDARLATRRRSFMTVRCRINLLNTPRPWNSWAGNGISIYAILYYVEKLRSGAGFFQSRSATARIRPARWTTCVSFITTFCYFPERYSNTVGLLLIYTQINFDSSIIR